MKFILPFRLALLILSSNATTAGAQALQVPRVEFGAEGGMLGAIGEGLYLNPMIGPRLTLNVTQRDAIELAADTLVPSEYGTYGLYFLQYKRATRRPSHWRVRPFFTAGTGGYYSYRKVPERRSTRLDGSVVIYPRSSYGELSRLNVATFGGGFERAVNRHASFRLEGAGFVVVENDGYLAFRILAGVSLPIGGYRETTTK